MPSKQFYTNVTQQGNTILYKGWHQEKDGTWTRVSESIDNFKPVFFLVSQYPEPKYHSFDGAALYPKVFPNITDAKRLRYGFKEDGRPLFGHEQMVEQFLGVQFPIKDGRIENDVSATKILYLDIETECEDGFPDIQSANERILTIAVQVCHLGKIETTVFSLRDFNTTRPDVRKEVFLDDEAMMLGTFVEFWKQQDPDIVSGWNIRFFDMPYIINRLRAIFGDHADYTLSPWGITKSKMVHRKYGTEDQAYTIEGVSQLDYLELYQKYTYNSKDSYALQAIAEDELGVGKLDHSEYPTFKSFYDGDFDKFVEYNIHDTELVRLLDERLRFIDTHLQIAYMARVVPEAAYSQVRVWEALLYHTGLQRGLVVPTKHDVEKVEQFKGAFVRPVTVGVHDWVVSFDLNSLYPSLIREFNVGPEAIVSSADVPAEAKSLLATNLVNKMLKDEISPDVTQSLTDADLTMAMNGTFYHRTQGVFSYLMKDLYDLRRSIKNEMLNIERQIETLDPDDVDRLALQKQAQQLDSLQMAYKISLNSAYGVMGCEFFKFFKIAFAEAITLSGQGTILMLMANLNKALNTMLDTDEDYVVAGDTDSMYVTLGPIVEMALGPKPDINKAVDFLDKFCDQMLQPVIDETCKTIGDRLNCAEHALEMSREIIASRAIWVANKKYILDVWDKEKVRYSKPKMIIKGMETARSSTAIIFRKRLLRAYRYMLDDDQAGLRSFWKAVELEIDTSPIEVIAYPRGVNNLEKYFCAKNIYQKGTPQHAKAALIHNHTVERLGLHLAYQYMRSGDKIRYVPLKEPNPLREAVIGFVGTLPKEFGVDAYVNRRDIFQKQFVIPLERVLNVMSWQMTTNRTLADIFGA